MQQDPSVPQSLADGHTNVTDRDIPGCDAWSLKFRRHIPPPSSGLESYYEYGGEKFPRKFGLHHKIKRRQKLQYNNLNPLRPIGNYIYHLLSQSVTLHFVFMCFE
jgi:hypothetical protein